MNRTDLKKIVSEEILSVLQEMYQLDELSPETKKRYISAAAVDIGDSRASASHAALNGDAHGVRSGLKRSLKRQRGIGKALKSLSEKSVPQPYDRSKRERMTSAQIKKRDSVGKKLLANEKQVAKFKKKYKDEWKDYLWATATSIAMGRRK